MGTAIDKSLNQTSSPSDGNAEGLKPSRGRIAYAVYALALGVSISVWFIAIGSPLWLDETANLWIIHDGLTHIWGRLGPLASPIYSYILWFSTRVTGTGPVGMRIPSVLAMLGAAYLFYLCARRLFKREMALVATIIFCANPIVVNLSTDARPYAFEVLATNATILVLLRLRKSESLWLAGLFGVLSALILYFHFLGAVVLPALLLCFVIWKYREGKVFWQQLSIGLVVFALACVPLIPDLVSMFSHAGTHVYMKSPGWILLFEVLCPGLQIVALIAGLLVVAATMRKAPRLDIKRWQVLLVVSLALVPALTVYGVSVATPIHMFAFRHLLVAVPGISLCWAFGLSLFPPRAVRLIFVLTLVVPIAAIYYTAPFARQHGYTWNYALAAAEKNASPDNAPVLICSDFPESNYVPMPLHSAKESRQFSQLADYKLTVPVVPLPRALNGEAKRVGNSFLARAERRHERFLAMGYEHSYKTLAWLRRRAAGSYAVRKLGVYDGVKVLEFLPLGKGGGG